ncbi:MAG: sulfite exporter TauE/SafE family protein [Deltaproteobacteria bacterium]|nr:sulfite exporter TauE/SafE family protein [Deltaproteobacteria bacterium]
MHFVVADIDVAIWVPPVTAFCISFFTSMGGVSGAFLLLPFQVSVLGFSSPSVSATNQLYNIVAIPGGVFRYFREGRMVWPLTAAVVVGTLPGVVTGTLIRVKYLPDPRSFKLFVAVVLFYIGGTLVKDLVWPKSKGAGPVFKKQGRPDLSKSDLSKKEACTGAGLIMRNCGLFHISFDFNGKTFDVRTPTIMLLCLIVGIIGGIYGIGGGSIVAPFFVTIFGLPVYVIAGPALMGTFVTSVASVITYQVIAPYYPGMAVAPDWLLGLLFGVGGFAGIYCGARMQKFVPAKAIKWVLAFCVFVPAIRYVLG